jgi:glycerol kinase
MTAGHRFPAVILAIDQSTTGSMCLVLDQQTALQSSNTDGSAPASWASAHQRSTNIVTDGSLVVLGEYERSERTSVVSA